MELIIHMETSNSRNNWFVRLLIVAFCGFLATLVVYRYFYIDPKAEISAGLLVLLAFILVLVLSELFDNFSVGKLVTMSRTIKEKEAQTTELKKENTELRGQLISISNSVSQRQTSTNIFGLPENMIDLLTVKKAPAEEIEDKKNEEETSPAAQPQVAVERQFDRAKAEELAIRNFVVSNNLQSFNLIRDAKLSTQFSGIDPITDITPIFDAYINATDSEIFVETRPTQYASIMFRDRLYVMLTKIHHYKTIKKANVYLALLLVNVPDPSTSRPPGSYVDRLQREFEPAITSGLLRIQVIEPTSEELLSLRSGG
ncbi:MULTISPECIES: hypothetical protein [Giesbergeria]|uniref:Uncharacterized protein n=1 Tax=Giesbergeria sinuosa TaxID=80883 RepID=A0ABV9QHI5_9BURK